jgi:hypothetical protein
MVGWVEPWFTSPTVLAPPRATRPMIFSEYLQPNNCGACLFEIGLQDEGAVKMPPGGAAESLVRHTQGGLVPTKRKRWADMPVQELCGFSDTRLSLSAIRPSSGSERAFIFRIALLR